MADLRLTELLALRDAGDEDVVLQVASEIALMPDTREMRFEREAARADLIADEFVPIAKPVSERELEELAEDAGF